MKRCISILILSSTVAWAGDKAPEVQTQEYYMGKSGALAGTQPTLNQYEEILKELMAVVRDATARNQIAQSVVNPFIARLNNTQKTLLSNIVTLIKKNQDLQKQAAEKDDAATQQALQESAQQLDAAFSPFVMLFASRPDLAMRPEEIMNLFGTALVDALAQSLRVTAPLPQIAPPSPSANSAGK